MHPSAEVNTYMYLISPNKTRTLDASFEKIALNNSHDRVGTFKEQDENK